MALTQKKLTDSFASQNNDVYIPEDLWIIIKQFMLCWKGRWQRKLKVVLQELHFDYDQIIFEEWYTPHCPRRRERKARRREYEFGTFINSRWSLMRRLTGNFTYPINERLFQLRQRDFRHELEYTNIYKMTFEHGDVMYYANEEHTKWCCPTKCKVEVVRVRKNTSEYRMAIENSC